MELKNENFHDLVKEGVVLVDFFAVWCGPCKMQSAVLEKIENSLKVIKVDIDQHEDLAKEFGVMSIPTLLLFKNGELVHKNVGFTPESEIQSWIH